MRRVSIHALLLVLSTCLVAAEQSLAASSDRSADRANVFLSGGHQVVTFEDAEGECGLLSFSGTGDSSQVPETFCDQCHDVPGFEEGAHGNPVTGVYRVEGFPIGDCVHCHVPGPGTPPYVFMPYGTDLEKRALCFYCHDGATAPAAVEPPEEHLPTSTVACVPCHYQHIPEQHGAGAACISCHGHDAGYEYAPGLFRRGGGHSRATPRTPKSTVTIFAARFSIAPRATTR